LHHRIGSVNVKGDLQMIVKQENISTAKMLNTWRYRMIRFLAGKRVVILNADIRQDRNTGVSVGPSAVDLLCLHYCFPDGTVIGYWRGSFNSYRARPTPAASNGPQQPVPSAAE
jgi:hypothetical protein